MGGNPAFRGTRVPVHLLAELCPRARVLPEGKCRRTGFEIDDAIGFQARLGERRREQVGPRDAPQDFAARLGRRPRPCPVRARIAATGLVLPTAQPMPSKN